ncbi:Uncharacterised protein [Bordetella pertussis]|nr:Uncharacterised protein [Bordetella pertussis]
MRLDHGDIGVQPLLGGQRGRDAAQGFQRGAGVVLDGFVQQVVLAREVVMHAGRLDAHVIGQVAIAEAIAAARADQLLRVVEQLLAGGVCAWRVHDRILPIRRLGR